MENIKNFKRTHMCGLVTENDINKEISLAPLFDD